MGALYIDPKCTLLETAQCENRALDLDNYLPIKFLLHICRLSCWNYAMPVYWARVLLIRTGIYISSLTETTGVNNATNPTGTNGIASVSPEVLQMVTYRLPASHNMVFSYVSGSHADDAVIDKTTVIVSACAASAFLCTCVLFMAFVIKWNSSRGLLQLWLIFFLGGGFMDNRSGC